MKPQTTDTVLMIRPATFGANPETAATNVFQRAAPADVDLATQVLREFDAFVELLDSRGVRVLVHDDTPSPPTPDAVFPNNWLSLHADGRAVLYPLLAPSRRDEVRPGLIDDIEVATGATWPQRIDLTSLATTGSFLEGTGSLVLDRAARVAYAGLSARTTVRGLAAFAAEVDYDVVPFHAIDPSGAPIYHTNVMMSVGDGFAVVCLECIPDDVQRAAVRARLERDGRDVIPISIHQRDEFLGNMLAVRSRDGAARIVMSERARNAIHPEQRRRLERFGDLVASPLETIEYLGGGSARCMLAEVHLPSANP